MLKLLSKVQHKAYEKGEFDEEQKRDLAETLQLINNFPWDAERSLTVIELTGPSVTIKDNDGNYLKIGLYFNGKYCLYCLYHTYLYEYHTGEIETVNKLASDFFNSILDLSAFEKHMISIGSRAHFETSKFEYRPNMLHVLLWTVFLVGYAIFIMGSIGFMIIKQLPSYVSILVVAALLGYLYFAFRMVHTAYTNRGNYLEISRGKDIFRFGATEDAIKVYRKSDIKEILSDFKQSGFRNNKMMGKNTIVFKNGETIGISYMLVNRLDFLTKFGDSMGNLTVPFVYTIGKSVSSPDLPA